MCISSMGDIFWAIIVLFNLNFNYIDDAISYSLESNKTYNIYIYIYIYIDYTNCLIFFLTYKYYFEKKCNLSKLKP